MALVKFDQEIDFLRIRDGGPWLCLGTVVLMHEWCPDLTPDVWEFGLNYTIYRLHDKEIGEKLASNIGRFIKTSQSELEKYVRIRVRNLTLINLLLWVLGRTGRRYGSLQAPWPMRMEEEMAVEDKRKQKISEPNDDSYWGDWKGNPSLGELRLGPALEDVQSAWSFAGTAGVADASDSSCPEAVRDHNPQIVCLLETKKGDSGWDALKTNKEEEEARIVEELDGWLAREETLWLQRSIILWLNQGDKNTKFFHARASHRRKNNWIQALLDGQGVKRTEQKTIMDIVTSYGSPFKIIW
ncbi:hypothetical protein QQ045_012001 [Rhodiola kirilowii]